MLKPYPYPHEVAIAAILKNEAPYVKEWLDYHIAAGVTKFYLYDNESTDNLADVLKPYIVRDVVEYTWWPGKLMQFPAYNDAVSRHKFDCRYLAAIDLDEFIYPCTGQDIPSVVSDVFTMNEKVGAYAVNWRVFGSAGHIAKDLSRGVLERFTRRGAKELTDNICVKSIVNPRCVDIFIHPHFAYLYTGKYAVNERGGVVPFEENKQLSGEKMVINHYMTKSREEFVEKRDRGRSDVIGTRTWEDFERCDVNDVFDDGILQYRAKMLTASVSGKSRIPQDVIGTIARDFPALSNLDLARRLDDVLAYWFFCRTELPRYVGTGKYYDYYTRLVANAILAAFTVTQDLWQLRLFLRMAPEVLPEYKELIMPCVGKILPILTNYYAGKRYQRECSELERLRQFCQVACG